MENRSDSARHHAIRIAMSAVATGLFAAVSVLLLHRHFDSETMAQHESLIRLGSVLAAAGLVVLLLGIYQKLVIGSFRTEKSIYMRLRLKNLSALGGAIWGFLFMACTVGLPQAALDSIIQSSPISPAGPLFMGAFGALIFGTISAMSSRQEADA